ncbi:MAG: hypothetical protein ABF651_00830 [Sporolactobacillus sp.]
MEDELLHQIIDKLGTMDERFNVIDQKFDSMDERFNAVDQKFDSMDERFNAMDQHLSAIDKKIDSINDQVGRNSEELAQHRVLLESLNSSKNRQEKILEALSLRSLEHETDIRTLEKAKTILH